MVDTVRCLSGVDAGVEGDDLIGQLGVGQDCCGEIGDVGGLAKPADQHPPTQLCRVTGQHASLGDQHRRQRVDRDPEGKADAKKRHSLCSPSSDAA